MQLAIGQYTQLGPIHFKYINPLMHGLGYMFLMCCFLEIVLGNIFLIDYILYFLLSMQKDLPWMQCRKYTETCLDYEAIQNCSHNCVDNKTELSSRLYWM